MKPSHTDMKADFTDSTFPVITFFNPTVTEREYADFLLRANSVIGTKKDDEFFIVLDSCPRNQGAIRFLHERVNTRLDVCTNPYRFWCDKICGGNKAMIEPNVIIGPFHGAKQRQKRREMLLKSKAAVVDARGIPQRLACLMQFARQHNAWIMTVVPPVLSSAHLAHFFHMLEEQNHDGIFAKTEAES